VGNDVLRGNLGNDVFVVSGADTVADFTSGNDRIDLQSYATISNFADVSALSTVSGGNLVINLGGGTTVTLLGTTAIAASDFIFHS